MSDALINGLAGAGGGIIAQLITYPLQTVNTRQQTNRDLKKEKKKLGTVEQICQVIKNEGWERLYGGLTPSLVGTAASQGVYYYFYQIFRNKAEAATLKQSLMGVGDGFVGMLSSLLAAALSGCVNVLFTNPIWVVVMHMQLSQIPYPGGVKLPEAPAPPNNILFVQNLLQETTPMMLQMLFCQYAGFKEVRMVEAKPSIAFVEYRDKMQSTIVMQELQAFKLTPQSSMLIEEDESLLA